MTLGIAVGKGSDIRCDTIAQWRILSKFRDWKSLFNGRWLQTIKINVPDRPSEIQRLNSVDFVYQLHFWLERSRILGVTSLRVPSRSPETVEFPG